MYVWGGEDVCVRKVMFVVGMQMWQRQLGVGVYLKDGKIYEGVVGVLRSIYVVGCTIYVCDEDICVQAWEFHM